MLYKLKGFSFAESAYAHAYVQHGQPLTLC